MDNDHLFVCFSMEATAAPEGDPLFHKEIKDFAKTINREGFRQFFEDRYRWHWYPIISSGFSSFSTHGDLNEELTEEQRYQCIGYAAEICAAEDGKRFISAFGLLTLLCRSCDEPREVPALTEFIMQICKRARTNTIDPNIPYWLGKIVVFQVATGVKPKGFAEWLWRCLFGNPTSNQRA